MREMNNRIKQKIDSFVQEKQYGFRKGKGTINAIFTLRMIMERTVEMQRDVFICFLDFEKAFDTVRHEPLMKMLSDIGMDGKDLRLLLFLYWD